MEMTVSIRNRSALHHLVCCLALLLYMPVCAQKQVPREYRIRDGRMEIELGRKISRGALDSFILQYNLAGIGLQHLVEKYISDSLKRYGWSIDRNDKNKIVISKRIGSLNDIAEPAERIEMTEKHPTIAEMFPAQNNGVVLGFNRFVHKFPFTIMDSSVEFFLRGHIRAGQVLLAGSFTGWQNHPLRMKLTDSGWVLPVKLRPGKYWYKFIVDGNWITDDDNLINENDGRGNTNSVYFRTNVNFTLKGYARARKVFLSGSFNDWQPQSLSMQPGDGGWKLPVYLANGTYVYRFVVDDEWIPDPANPETFPNEFNSVNSVIRIGKPLMFQLPGFTSARQVMLVGSFNGWRRNELPMIRRSDGWELPYTLGAGNYEYGFLVDGKMMPDPGVPMHVKDHSYLVIDPNYTFRLKGYANAKNVILSGDFDGWSPNTIHMQHSGDEWIFSVHLSAGKHTYEFIVDGDWITDPGNPLFEHNAQRTGNSVLWIEN